MNNGREVKIKEKEFVYPIYKFLSYEMLYFQFDSKTYWQIDDLIHSLEFDKKKCIPTKVVVEESTRIKKAKDWFLKRKIILYGYRVKSLPKELIVEINWPEKVNEKHKYDFYSVDEIIKKELKSKKLRSKK